jgi:hypothetical protein
MQRQERLGETRRKGGLGLSDTIFSTSHLRCVTGNEVEHGLGRIELRNGWENTTSITSEEDDIAWVICGQTRNLSVVNVLDRVGTAKY